MEDVLCREYLGLWSTTLGRPRAERSKYEHALTLPPRSWQFLEGIRDFSFGGMNQLWLILPCISIIARLFEQGEFEKLSGQLPPSPKITCCGCEHEEHRFVRCRRALTSPDCNTSVIDQPIFELPFLQDVCVCRNISRQSRICDDTRMM